MDCKKLYSVLCCSLLLGLSAKAQQAGTTEASDMPKKKVGYQVNGVSFNSQKSDFAPTYEGANRIVFSSNRDSTPLPKKVLKWTKTAPLDLFEANIDPTKTASQPIKLTDLSSEVHDASVVFSKDGNKVYITRNQIKSGLFGFDDDGVSRLKIYSAEKVNGKWTHFKELPINGKGYSTAHASISPKGDWLYFASDMPGGKGESDLYRVAVLPNGNYGDPENLGSSINTSGKDTYPFVTESNILYFTSDGRKGNGGMDLYSVDLNNPKAPVVHLEAPLNGNYDDFALIINETDCNGYFSSNRPGGKGDEDIYFFKEVPLPDGEAENQMLTEESSESDHNDSNSSTNRNAVPVGTDLVAFLDLDPILFGFDQADLRESAKPTLEEVAQFLKTHPDLKIEIQGHTDSRGSAEYNRYLSQRRALSVKTYLSSLGVIPSRMGIMGLGEAQQPVSCSPCTEEQHQQNRSTDLVVIIK